MPPKTLLRLGLGFLFLALLVYFYSAHWLKTRNFAPLDLPVTLQTRQLKSPPFQINLRETYFVALWLDHSIEDGYDDGRCNDSALHGSQWRVYRLGAKPDQPRRLWDSSEELTRVWEYHSDRINVSSGRYELEWDLPPAAACLNSRHPRLVIYTGDADYRQAVAFLQTSCVFLFATGLVLMMFATSRALRRISRTIEAPRMFSEIVLRNVLPITKHTPLSPIHGLPHWGLFCGAILWILIFIFMVFGPQPSKGLFVTWKNRDAVVWEKSPWPDALEIYVRVPARFFVNGQEILRSDLHAKLIEQLSRRAEWTVYFEAEPDVPYMEAVYAMETIQVCGAKVIWITPKMREDWQHKLSESEDRTKSEVPEGVVQGLRLIQDLWPRFVPQDVPAPRPCGIAHRNRAILLLRQILRPECGKVHQRRPGWV
jgi:biopolymer transport protein ExbD